MFTWTLWKGYQLLIIGLIIASSINSCYHSNDRESNDSDWITELFKYLGRGFWYYLGAYCNTIIPMKSFLKLMAQKKKKKKNRVIS